MRTAIWPRVECVRQADRHTHWMNGRGRALHYDLFQELSVLSRVVSTNKGTTKYSDTCKFMSNSVFWVLTRQKNTHSKRGLFVVVFLSLELHFSVKAFLFSFERASGTVHKDVPH